MPDSTVAPSSTPTPTVYNPLSKLAILGLGLSALYAGIVVVETLIALRSYTPLFLPDWLLILPLAGAALCLLALRQIRNSEGTLSGDKLCRWGLALSVLSGLGYGAYYLATGWAIQHQANSFLMTKGDDSGFFDHLQRGKREDIERAFLLTQRWSQRKNKSPENRESMSFYKQPVDTKDPRGLLDQFTDSTIVHRIVQSGRENKPIVPLGVRSWKYQNGEYVVERSYRIETSEMAMDILVPVQSNETDSGPGEPRHWNVLWEQVRPLTAAELTPLGRNVEVLRNKASNFFQIWLKHFELGILSEDVPAHDVKWDSSALKITDEGRLKKIREELDCIFTTKGFKEFAKDELARLRVDKVKNADIPWQEADGHVEFIFPINVALPATTPRPNVVEIHLTVRSKEKINPSEGIPTGNIGWNVVSYKVVYVRDLPVAQGQ